MIDAARLTSTRPTRTGTRDFARTTLRSRHRALVRSFAETIFTSDASPGTARLDAFVDDVDGFISPASKTLRFGLLAMLDVIRVAPVFLVRRLAFFEDLSLAERTTMLERMETSRVGLLCLIFVAFKTIMTLAYYEHPGELEAVGYPGPERVRYTQITATPAPTATSAPATPVPGTDER